MQKAIQSLIFLTVTFFGFGKARFAPGTWGSIGGILLFYVTHLPLAYWLELNMTLFTYIYVGFITGLFVVGTIATHYYIKNQPNKDPKEVVIDEVVGQLIVCLAVFLFFAYHYGMFNNTQMQHQAAYYYLTYATTIYPISFLLFRLFDIWKPWPICWCDKNIKGALGVMVDDVLAGFAGALVATAMAYALIATYAGSLIFKYLHHSWGIYRFLY